MITALLASKNIATMEIKDGYSILPYASNGLMNSFFTINFFSSKLKYAQRKYFRFFILKMSFCRMKTPFYDRPRVLV